MALPARMRAMFNDERPHQALGQERPASRYTPSTRPFREHPEPIPYPSHLEVRLASQDSTIRWKSRKIFVSPLLGREEVGLEEVGDGVRSVFFGPVPLGGLDESDSRIMDVQGRMRRRR